jgi:hypothetical protein
MDVRYRVPLRWVGAAHLRLTVRAEQEKRAAERASKRVANRRTKGRR